MKTNKMIATGLAATAIIAVSFSSSFAMGGGHGGMGGHGNGGGGLSQYVTAEEKAEMQSLGDEERQTYMNELKAKYGVSSSKGRGQGKMQDRGNSHGGGHGNENHNPGDMIANIPVSDLSDSEKEILFYGYSEEMVARDAYNYLATLYPEESVFSKIATSEQKHMDSIKVLLDRYNLDAPTGYGELQSTFDTLKSQGEKSLKDALEVGLQIEVLDIEDIENSISNTDNEDFKVVFTNIGGASYNHMRSFLQAFDANGLIPNTNTSEFLSEDDLDIKGPLKYKLAERLESKGIVLPEQVNSETLKAKGPNSDSHGSSSKGNMGKGKGSSISSSLNGARINVALKNKYKNTYEEKYGSLIVKMNDSQLEDFIGKVDNVLEKVNTGNYSDATKEKYNAMLIALKEIAVDNIDEDSILEELFN